MFFSTGGGHGGGWWSYMRQESDNQPRVTRDLLWRVYAYARPYRFRVGLMLLTILFTTGVGLIQPLLMRDLIDRALPERDFGRLNLLALGMIAIPLVTGLLGVFQRYLGSSIGETLIYTLRSDLYHHLQRMSLRFFTHTKTGEIMSRLSRDVVGAQQAVTGTAVSIVSNVVALVATMAVMISLEWRLTLLAVAIFPLFILPARRVATLLRDITRQQMTVNAQMSAIMNETLNVSGALLVKIFGREANEYGRFRDRAVQVRDIGIRQAMIGRWFFLGLSLVSAIGTALVFWLGGYLVLQGQFTVGTIVAFGAYLAQLYGPISALANARVDFATSLVSFERVFEVLDMPHEIADRPGAIDLDRVEGRVAFDEVSFAYAPPGEESAPALTEVKRWGRGEDVELFSRSVRLTELRAANGEVASGGTFDGADGLSDAAPAGPRFAVRDVSFTIEPGQLAALVGPSGAGKTTVTYLLPRLYDPTSGRICFDGHDLRDVTLSSLTRQIGMVTQETYLFHDTVRANLLYARPDATQAEIEEACRAANIHDFIADLPDGYDTIVGERGYRLSGGEKQRVAIARVILKDPRILVLDEATSHLDSQSEALIQAALTRVMRGRTSLVIAHRLSTVLAADVILVMEKGRLVERGTHAELLERSGLYARLFHTQFRHVPGTPPAGEPPATDGPETPPPGGPRFRGRSMAGPFRDRHVFRVGGDAAPDEPTEDVIR